MKKSIFVVFFAIVMCAIGYFTLNYFMFLRSGTFYENSTINGIDVSKKTKEEAQELVMNDMFEKINQVDVDLVAQDKIIEIHGETLDIGGDVNKSIEKAFNYGRSKNLLKNIEKKNQIKNNGFASSIPVDSLITNLNDEVERIALSLNSEEKNAQFVFNASNKEEPFTIFSETNGKTVDKQSLMELLINAIQTGQKSIEVPIVEVQAQVTDSLIQNYIALRGEFSTSIQYSPNGRKHNVLEALKNFNGLIIEPNQVISFNSTTGEHTKDNGYKKANIIFAGEFTEGYGGGVCQASTTLYNALINANLEILEVHPHSLPVSYVPLGLDAMVNFGTSDLVFRNSTQKPIYIQTYSDEQNVYAKVYGEKFADGFEVKYRTECVDVIPHNGDEIVQDTQHKYSNKITFQGEYMRLRYPKEGYESKTYADYYFNGELIDEKIIRNDKYNSQNGIILEGTEILCEGMKLPPNSISFIPPQTENNLSQSQIASKIRSTSDPSYAP